MMEEEIWGMTAERIERDLDTMRRARMLVLTDEDAEEIKANSAHSFSWRKHFFLPDTCAGRCCTRS